MHAHIHQLLSLRDGEPVEAAVACHVGQCSTCADQVARLLRIQRDLRSLPTIDAPAAGWDAIQDRLRCRLPDRRPDGLADLRPDRLQQGPQEGAQDQPDTARVQWSLVAGLAGIAVLVVIVSVWAVQSRQRLEVAATDVPTSPAVGVIPDPVVVPTVDQLMAQSRQLDDLLQDLPQRPSVERIAMAATLDSIEQRIQWLDVQLSFASTADLNEVQSQRLWSERVDLMDSLVKVRYAESSSLQF
ncbi:MAG TPA: hypothetical protein VGN07_05960 [Steroidobacteraceae bacterium]|jgi:hypothetical protein